MRLTDTIHAGLRATREQGFRAGLASLGVVIGTGSVLLLVAIGLGVKADVLRQVEQLGTNVAFVVPGKLSPNGEPEHMSMLGISSLSLKDARDLSRVPGVRAAIPVTFVTGSVERGSASHSAMVIAVDHRMQGVGSTAVASGRFYTASEAEEQVCVIGDGVRLDAFADASPIGKQLRIKGAPFRVVGTLEPEEESLFSAFSFSRVVYIPWGTAQRLFPNAQINRIIVQTDYAADPDKLMPALHSVLLRNHGREDFGILTYRQLLSAIFRVFNIVTALVVGISAISLLVAGIGIMNVMLISVSERTREIGVRLTSGATRRDISLQFLTESVLLSLTGGALGIAVAALAAALIDRWTVLHPLVTPGAVALSFGVCFLVGVVFGTSPALRAASLTPVDALRAE